MSIGGAGTRAGTIAATIVDTAVGVVCLIEDGCITFANPGFARLFGIAQGDLSPGLPFQDFVGRESRACVTASLKSILTTGETVEFTFRGIDRDKKSLEINFRGGAAGRAGGMAIVGIATDITDASRTEARLNYLAFYDALTGLPNRALFFDWLRGAVIASRRSGAGFALLSGDLDGFKQVNDSFGHDTGDALLQAVGRKLESTVRETDTVARMGGDEFSIILAGGVEPERAALIAGRIVRELADPINVAGKECHIGVSIGVAMFPAHGDTIEDIYGAADRAMYASKAAGRNRYSFAQSGGVGEGVKLSFVDWDGTYDLGIHRIDLQHRRLAELINVLGEDLKNGRDESRLAESLEDLVSFATLHFETEERLLTTYGVPTAAAHAEEHRRLLDDVRSMAVSIDSSSMMLTMRYLQEWLLRHISGTDRAMVKELRARRYQEPSPAQDSRQRMA